MNEAYRKMINRSEKNNDEDFFKTPEDAIMNLLYREKFIGSILDPCCGTGTIPKMCKAFDYTSVIGSDIVDRGYEDVKIIDFLEHDWRLFSPNNIICNPPYKYAEEFFDKAYKLANGKVAMLLRLMWLEGQGRYKRIFSIYPPSRVFVFSYRLSFTTPKDGNKNPSGMTPYAWFVWDKNDNNKITIVNWISK